LLQLQPRLHRLEKLTKLARALIEPLASIPGVHLEQFPDTLRDQTKDQRTADKPTLPAPTRAVSSSAHRRLCGYTEC
jgi:hypothetical protein